MVPHKRIDLALRAWEEVRGVTGGRLLIAGDGPERARLEDLAGSGVEFLGKVDEVQKARLMAESWILLHPARHEGWGLVITEAGACGTPTVSFDVPGVVDSVADRASGLLVHSEDEFVTAWIALAQDSARRRILGQGAREFSRGFTMAATLDAFNGILEDAMRTRRR